MTANTQPISPIAPALQIQSAVLTAANTALDGTGAVATFFTADAVNGSRVPRARIVHRGSNAATVLRIFANNGLTNGTAANNVLVAEVTVPLNTISQAAASVFLDVWLNMVLPAGWKLNYTIGTLVAAGHSVVCPDAGHY